MAIIDSSEKVLLLFKEKFGLDGDGDMDAVGLFAFSLVEKERMEWMEHIRNVHGQEPTAQQISQWYQDKPDTYFVEIGKSAYRWFYGFSRALLAEEIDSGKKEAIRDALGDLGKFWHDFWRGNLVGLTSNLFFAFLVVVFVAYIASDFSFVAWAKKFIPLSH
jgi:hypothetical protein